MTNQNSEVLPLIKTIRAQRVIIDSDLARLYGVSTKRLNQQMRRNQRRFPPDFAFKLSLREAVGWLQIATTLGGRNMKNLPIAYTEHGAVMAANVLNSERAILMSVEVVRAFIRLRRVVVSHERLAQKVAQLETAMKTGLADHNRKIDGILLALKQLITVPAPISKKRIGFAEERPAL